MLEKNATYSMDSQMNQHFNTEELKKSEELKKTEEIRRTSSLRDMFTREKLKYFGHVMRSDRLEKSVMMGMGDGARGRGRSKTRWLDEIKECTGLSLQELQDAAQDRDGWRGKIMDVTRGRQAT